MIFIWYSDSQIQVCAMYQTRRGGSGLRFTPYCGLQGNGTALAMGVHTFFLDSLATYSAKTDSPPSFRPEL